MNSRDIEKRAHELERALLEFHQELCKCGAYAWLSLPPISKQDTVVEKQGMEINVRIGVDER